MREATTVEGHAVRALYLTTGAADLYLETGETLLLETLTRQGQDMVVDSAAEGLAMLKQEAPDVLVISLSLPEPDGYWLNREVRKLPPIREARF